MGDVPRRSRCAVRLLSCTVSTVLAAVLLSGRVSYRGLCRIVGPQIDRLGPNAECKSVPEAVLQLKQRSMEHLNAYLANQADTDASAAADDVDVMEQPAEDAVEDDAIQKMATRLGGSKRPRTSGSKKG